MKKNLRWWPFLAYRDNKRYGTGYLDTSIAHEDYKRGIHISLPQDLELIMDSEFEYNGKKMKALTVHRCPHWEESLYVFAREIE
tara:strand:- start:8596 stop:8847 length:252 start_codon:yes stop_codon:yes gene_type:complete